MAWNLKKTIFIKDVCLTLIISIVVIILTSSIHSICMHLGIFKEVIETVICISCLAHIFLYLIDISLLQIVLSLSIQLVLYKSLSNFPTITTRSFKCIYSALAFLVNILWMLAFTIQSQISMTELVACFAIISTAPLAIFYYLGHSESAGVKS